MSDLREEVARAICEARALLGTKPAKPAPWSSEVDKRAADAAIAIVLEHGARLGDAEQSRARASEKEGDPPTAVAFVSGWHGCAYRLATALRNLDPRRQG